MTNKIITAAEFKKLKYYLSLPEDLNEELDVATRIFPFKTNNYIVESLIDWNHIRHDPIFRINFPGRRMLSEKNYNLILLLLKRQAPEIEILNAANLIKTTILPKEIYTPSKYLPVLNNKPLYGFIHQYQNTLIAMARPAKNCFAHCTYCLVWPIHILNGCKYGYDEPELPVKYLDCHSEVSDILFTGGDMLNMSAPMLKKYIIPLLSVKSMKTIRIASRSLAWWPYRFTHENDSAELLDFFKEIIGHNKHLTILSHICHPKELSTPQVEEAIRNVRATGAVIRCQTPMIKTVNDSVDILVSLLEKEISLGLIPYYLFIDANTSYQGSFKVPLADAYTLFNETMKKVSGLVKTMRGPVITYDCFKIEIVGIDEIHGEKRFILKCLQSPDPRQQGKIASIPYDTDIVDLEKSTVAF